MVKILRREIHAGRLARMSGLQHRSEMAEAVKRGADHMRDVIRDSITEGAVSGPGHVPSAPGEPPNADTHELDQSIVSEVLPSSLRGRVSAQSEKAAPLEFGTATVAERPFMKPGADKARPQARQYVIDAQRRITRGG